VGFLSARTALVRFLARPPSRLDRDAVARAVTRRTFRELEGGEASQASGWVGIHDPLATEIGAADLFFQHWLVVGFRYDRRTVPPKLLFLERRRAEVAARAAQDVERLGRVLRRQIKADVEARLLARALPAPRLFDCVWNLESGHVWFSGRLRGAQEAFTDLFARTFGVAPVALGPSLAAEHAGLPSRIVETLRAVEPARFAGEETANEERRVPRLQLEEVAG
jgi:hypothetical protein